MKKVSCFVNLNILHACIMDSHCALTLNPNLVWPENIEDGRKSNTNLKQFKLTKVNFLRFTFRVLGNLEQAAHDLRLACQIHHDKEAGDWLREVTKI